MRVRDLIHLLQTRAEPDSEVCFTAFINGKNKTVVQTGGQSYEMDFESVYMGGECIYEDRPVYELDKDEKVCWIVVPDNFIHNTFVGLEDYDLPAATGGALDENGKNIRRAEQKERAIREQEEAVRIAKLQNEIEQI